MRTAFLCLKPMSGIAYMSKSGQSVNMHGVFQTEVHQNMAGHKHTNHHTTCKCCAVSLVIVAMMVMIFEVFNCQKCQHCHKGSQVAKTRGDVCHWFKIFSLM